MKMLQLMSILGLTSSEHCLQIIACPVFCSCMVSRHPYNWEQNMMNQRIRVPLGGSRIPRLDQACHFNTSNEHQFLIVLVW